jgi:Na+-transporting methylmalonyl-CoA/oxaloacetate decarboxylase gamma subunit
MRDALEITLIGMSLVFGAIFLLWGLMVLLVRLTAENAAAPDPALNAQNLAEKQRKQRAAVVAVAVALARQSEAHLFPLPPTALVSAWQAVKRANSLTVKRLIRHRN